MRNLLKILLLLGLSNSACSNKSKKIIMEEITLTETPEDRSLINFWREFSVKFNSLDTSALRKVSLDSIWLWGDHISSNEFIKRYHSGYPNSTDFSGLLDTNKIRYSTVGCYPNPPVKEAIKVKYDNAFKCRQIAVITDTLGSLVKGVEFSFLVTTKGYRLFALDYCTYYWRFDNSIIDTTTKN
jgi:hypothetical protein